MNKAQAIEMLNSYLGDEVLTTRNTSFSNFVGESSETGF